METLVGGIPVDALINAGAAGAVILVVILFLRFIRERDKNWQEFFTTIRTEDRQQSDKILVVMDRLITRVEALEDKFDHHDTMEMEVLRSLTVLMAKVAEKETVPAHNTPRRR